MVLRVGVCVLLPQCCHELVGDVLCVLHRASDINPQEWYSCVHPHLLMPQSAYRLSYALHSWAGSVGEPLGHGRRASAVLPRDGRGSGVVMVLLLSCIPGRAGRVLSQTVGAHPRTGCAGDTRLPATRPAVPRWLYVTPQFGSICAEPASAPEMLRHLTGIDHLMAKIPRPQFALRRHGATPLLLTC